MTTKHVSAPLELNARQLRARLRQLEHAFSEASRELALVRGDRDRALKSAADAWSFSRAVLKTSRANS